MYTSLCKVFPRLTAECKAQLWQSTILTRINFTPTFAVLVFEMKINRIYHMAYVSKVSKGLNIFVPLTLNTTSFCRDMCSTVELVKFVWICPANLIRGKRQMAPFI